MYTIHEGEIVFKEKYGTWARQRLYVKPPEQANLVTLDENATSDFANLFTTIFLPQGYPNSVSKDYLKYQIWDTAQAFCSTVTGTLATQAVLHGVGVGDTNATPLAATITWVLKDGCGHIGRIIFAYTHGSYLDAYSKKWRLYADTLNDAAMCMELALPLFKRFTTMVLCISTVMKSIVGVAGGATRAAMTQHHAIRGNMADVSAKDSAQETAVNLVASVAALLILSIFGNSITIFAIMMVHHIIFNYLAVRAVCLRTLNEPRFLQVIDAYLKEEIIATPCQINRNEPIVFYQMGSNLLDLKLCGFKIKIGHSIQKLIKQQPKAFYVKNIEALYEDRKYMLFPDVYNPKMYVVLKDTAQTSDILCAYFHAAILAIAICAINDYPLAIYKRFKNVTRPFAQVCSTLQNVDWSGENTDDPHAKFKRTPSIELMAYIDRIVQKEWIQMRRGLVSIGWDLTKHLLVVDEWRVCTATIVTKSKAVDDDVATSDSDHALPERLVTFDDLNSTFTPDNLLRDTYTIEPEDREPSDLSINSRAENSLENYMNKYQPITTKQN